MSEDGKHLGNGEKVPGREILFPEGAQLIKLSKKTLRENGTIFHAGSLETDDHTNGNDSLTPALTPNLKTLLDSMSVIAQQGQEAMRRGLLTSPSRRKSTRTLRRNHRS